MAIDPIFADPVKALCALTVIHDVLVTVGAAPPRLALALVAPIQGDARAMGAFMALATCGGLNATVAARPAIIALAKHRAVFLCADPLLTSA